MKEQAGNLSVYLKLSNTFVQEGAFYLFPLLRNLA